MGQLSLLAEPESRSHPKELGAFYTEELPTRFLVDWAVRSPGDAVMDPSFGEGVFLRAACRRISDLGGIASHQVFGVEIDKEAHAKTLDALSEEFGLTESRVVCRDFFELAPGFRRVVSVVGNPPFVRYQRFRGEVRRQALKRASEQGVKLPELASSWAPFLVHAISMIRAGGRLAMVVPFELTCASYALPVLEYLARSFGLVTLLSFKDRLFPQLSEDTLLLLAENKGADSTEFRWQELSNSGQLADLIARGASSSIEDASELDHEALCRGERRLIEYFLPEKVRDLYHLIAGLPDVKRLGDMASVGIGYVTGANDYFHLNPSSVRRWGIPDVFLKPAVRKGRGLAGLRFGEKDWREGLDSGDTSYLLHIEYGLKLTDGVREYLAEGVRQGVPHAYKCRTRSPWYRVPHVYLADAFLTYMSGIRPKLVANEARAFAPNNLHLVRMHPGCALDGLHLAALWQTSLTSLSVELHGHSLGGGLLKMEPAEARDVLIPTASGPTMLALADELDEVSRKGKTEEVRQRANRGILIDGLGLSDADCQLLESGAEALMNRRYHQARRGNHAT